MLLTVVPVRSSHPIGSVAVWLLIGLPIGLVATVVLTYALNLPYWDDYLVQEQLVLMKSQPTGRQKLWHLFDQHWEHRIVWTRLVFAGWYKLTGSLNYYGLTLVGVSGLLGLFALLTRIFWRLNLPWLYLLPVPFWLFTLQSHENLLWAMASIQNFWVLVFALGSFYALAHPTPKAKWLALALAVLATYTSGNGALVLIAGGMTLVWQVVNREGRRRSDGSVTGESTSNSLEFWQRWGFVGIWAFVAMVSIGFYFWGYKRITFFPSPFRYPFTDWIKAYFVFFGAFADPYPYSGAGAYGYENPLWLTLIVGAILVSVGAYCLIGGGKEEWRRGGKEAESPLFSSPPFLLSSFFISSFLFLLATAAITVYSRVGFAGPGYLLQGRYKIYSALMLVVVYLFLLYRFGPLRKLVLRWGWAALVMLTIGQSLFTDYLCLEGIINQHRRTTAEYFNFLVNTPTDQQRAVGSVFTPTEPVFFGGQVAQLGAKSWLLSPTTEKLNRFDTQRFMYWIEKSNSVNPSIFMPTDGTYIYMTSGVNTYLFPARPLRPSPTALSGLDGYFRAEGIRAQVLQEHLKPGTYRFGLLTNRKGQLDLRMTSQTVTFTGL